MSGMYDFPNDTQLWKMRLANTVSNVFCYHDAMTCINEMTMYESGKDAELLGNEKDQEGRITTMSVRTFDQFDEGTMRREFVYTLDEACTQPMDVIDVSQDALTAYVKLGEYY